MTEKIESWDIFKKCDKEGKGRREAEEGQAHMLNKIFKYIHTHRHTHTHTYKHTQTHTQSHTHTHIYIYIFIYIYIYIYIYIGDIKRF